MSVRGSGSVSCDRLSSAWGLLHNACYLSLLSRFGILSCHKIRQCWKLREDQLGARGDRVLTDILTASRNFMHFDSCWLHHHDIRCLIRSVHGASHALGAIPEFLLVVLRMCPGSTPAPNDDYGLLN